MRSSDPQSIKFYNEAEQRFGKLAPGSDRYKKAQIYASECENYNDIVFPDGKTLDVMAHDKLKTEQNADEFGDVERNLFLSCFDSLKNKFPLLDKNWIFNS